MNINSLGEQEKVIERDFFWNLQTFLLNAEREDIFF